jgi:hypothetical protein
MPFIPALKLARLSAMRSLCRSSKFLILFFIASFGLTGCASAQTIGNEFINFFIGEKVRLNIQSIITTAILLIFMIGIGFDLLNVILSQVGISLGYLFGSFYNENQIEFPQLVLIILSRLVLLVFIGIMLTMSNDIVTFIEGIVPKPLPKP